MRALKWTAVFWGLMLFQAIRAQEDGYAQVVAISDPAGHSGMLGWKVKYAKPDEVQDVCIELFYKFWDPNVDGDVPSKKKMCVVWSRKAPKTVSFTVFLNAKKSVIVVDGKANPGAGCPLDATFAVAQKPNRNGDGVYVLCQKPVDPKQPAEMGNTQDAAAWIELGITDIL
jgi:hypothetical protein